VAILIVADVHANLAAFESVLAEAQSEARVDAIWCLGDLVGYGPQPSECISLLRRYPHLMVAGNHDLAAAGVLGTEEFNPVAAEAACWTAEQLGEEDQAFIRGLPLTLQDGEFTLVHGSLRDPVWDYLMSESLAATHLSRQPTPYGLVGHSHFPLLYFEAGEELALEDGESIDLNASRFVANPG
jgi:predicted phosphodiesterase